MTFDVNAARQAAFRRLALQTPRAVVLSADDLSLLAGALTLFHVQGDPTAITGTPSSKFDHQAAVERLATHLGVTLGTWTSTEVARPEPQRERVVLDIPEPEDRDWLDNLHAEDAGPRPRSLRTPEQRAALRDGADARPFSSFHTDANGDI